MKRYHYVGAFKIAEPPLTNQQPMLHSAKVTNLYKL